MPRLTLELGARYDYEFLPAPVAEPDQPRRSGSRRMRSCRIIRATRTTLDARVGFSFDAYGDGKTVVRGGYGMFYGRITNGNLLNVLLNTGSPNGQYTTTVKPTYTSPVLRPSRTFLREDRHRRRAVFPGEEPAEPDGAGVRSDGAAAVWARNGIPASATWVRWAANCRTSWI